MKVSDRHFVAPDNNQASKGQRHYINLITAMGYKAANPTGMCYGLAHMMGQAVLAQETTQFMKRMVRITWIHPDKIVEIMDKAREARVKLLKETKATLLAKNPNQPIDQVELQKELVKRETELAEQSRNELTNRKKQIEESLEKKYSVQYRKELKNLLLEKLSPEDRSKFETIFKEWDNMEESESKKTKENEIWQQLDTLVNSTLTEREIRQILYKADSSIQDAWTNERNLALSELCIQSSDLALAYADLPNLFDGIALYFNPAHQAHTDLFETKPRFQQESHLVRPLVSPSVLDDPSLPKNKSTIANLETITGIYDEQKLSATLKSLSDAFDKDQFKGPLAITIGACKHAISLHYDANKKKWHVFDPNLQFTAMIPANEPDVVAKKIFRAYKFNDSTSPFITMAMSLSVTQKDENQARKFLSDLTNSPTWQSILDPNTLLSKKDRNDTSWLTFAVMYDTREDFVINLIDLASKNNLIDSDHKFELILSCVQLNHFNTMETLLKNAPPLESEAMAKLLGGCVSGNLLEGAKLCLKYGGDPTDARLLKAAQDAKNTRLEQVLKIGIDIENLKNEKNILGNTPVNEARLKALTAVSNEALTSENPDILTSYKALNHQIRMLTDDKSLDQTALKEPLSNLYKSIQDDPHQIDKLWERLKEIKSSALNQSFFSRHKTLLLISTALSVAAAVTLSVLSAGVLAPIAIGAIGAGITLAGIGSGVAISKFADKKILNETESEKIAKRAEIQPIVSSAAKNDQGIKLHSAFPPAEPALNNKVVSINRSKPSLINDSIFNSKKSVSKEEPTPTIEKPNLKRAP